MNSKNAFDGHDAGDLNKVLDKNELGGMLQNLDDDGFKKRARKSSVPQKHYNVVDSLYRSKIKNIDGSLK